MSAAFEHTQQAEVETRPIVAAELVAIKSKIVDTWPVMMVALGIVLTILWAGSLVWILMWSILALT